MNPYDEVLYPGHPQVQTHPDRLATMGTLFGMNPAPVARCRVLELACGSGSNLIPMAWGLPESTFLGVDLAARPIAAGQDIAAELGLTNIRLAQADLLDLVPGWEQFDYIIAHGLFSWVPAPVREQVLKICRHSLAPNGIAFISYNAYPGCHLRHMVREMMLFHVQGLKDPQERTRQATALVSFLAQGQSVDDPYRHWMSAELNQILQYDPGHLFHDELADTYQPFYFTQFLSAASRQELKFLGEADFFEMSDHPFPQSVREKLNELSGTRLLREQYLDFLKCRRFRQTLLCHEHIALSPRPLLHTIPAFRVSSSIMPSTREVDLRPDISVCFKTPRGAKAETDYALGKACLLVLSERGFAGLPFSELLQMAEDQLSQLGVETEDHESNVESISAFLLELYGSGVVDFHSHSPACSRQIGDRPLASPVARCQIRRGKVVTTLFHSAVQVQDEIGRQLLLWLDGTLDRPALIERLTQFIKSRRASDGPDATEVPSAEEIGRELDKGLNALARMGLLLS